LLRTPHTDDGLHDYTHADTGYGHYFFTHYTTLLYFLPTGLLLHTTFLSHTLHSTRHSTRRLTPTHTPRLDFTHTYTRTLHTRRDDGHPPTHTTPPYYTRRTTLLSHTRYLHTTLTLLLSTPSFTTTTHSTPTAYTDTLTTHDFFGYLLHYYGLHTLRTTLLPDTRLHAFYTTFYTHYFTAFTTTTHADLLYLLTTRLHTFDTTRPLRRYFITYGNPKTVVFGSHTNRTTNGLYLFSTHLGLARHSFIHIQGFQGSRPLAFKKGPNFKARFFNPNSKRGNSRQRFFSNPGGLGKGANLAFSFFSKHTFWGVGTQIFFFPNTQKGGGAIFSKPKEKFN